MGIVLIRLLLVAAAVYGIYRIWTKKDKVKRPKTEFPYKWRAVLERKVKFYNGLDSEMKKHFEYKVHEFILNHKITGVDTLIDITDKLLVASSAVIPILKFTDWQYPKLDEVLIYSDTFNTDFETQGQNRGILGMVGTGVMNRKMILSQKALRKGFRNAYDGKNTAIHEFVHLIDMADGSADGIPEVLTDKQYVIPWMKLIDKKMNEIAAGKANINPYAASRPVEFFAVVSEYFFEKPDYLKKEHPELYNYYTEFFKMDLSGNYTHKQTKKIQRNAKCPCGSGKKYKHCCGR